MDGFAEKVKKFFTRKKKPDPAKSRAAYAAYRKKMAKHPDTIVNTLRFKEWQKTAKPGK